MSYQRFSNLMPIEDRTSSPIIMQFLRPGLLSCRSLSFNSPRGPVEPPPSNGYLTSFEEKATSQEEKCCCGNYNSITCDITGDKCTDKHHISIGCYQRCIKDQPEVKPIFGDCSKCETLNSKKWEIDYEGGDDIR
ncbi:hypothetical protein QQP08_010232 [Theobroma cacao]|nr:hypothetical protein QQP08_010232 [Theobroma cacao]